VHLDSECLNAMVAGRSNGNANGSGYLAAAQLYEA